MRITMQAVADGLKGLPLRTRSLGMIERDDNQVPASGVRAGSLLAQDHAAARDALAKAGLTAADITSIDMANQRETTVVLNRCRGLLMCNAIVGQERRAGPTMTSKRSELSE